MPSLQSSVFYVSGIEVKRASTSAGIDRKLQRTKTAPTVSGVDFSRCDKSSTDFQQQDNHILK